jgi:hypothetical protein
MGFGEPLSVSHKLVIGFQFQIILEPSPRHPEFTSRLVHRERARNRADRLSRGARHGIAGAGGRGI